MNEPQAQAAQAVQAAELSEAPEANVVPARVADDPKKRWFIVQVHSNFESKVRDAIVEEIKTLGLDRFVDEVEVPKEIVEIRRGRQTTSAERKFFPGYVLVKMEANDSVVHAIRSVPRVIAFLGSKDKPAPIPEREAEKLLHQIREGIENPRPSVTFEIGEQVRVSDGPFASFNGLVEDVDDDRAKIKVSVSIFGRATPVELDFGQVEKL